MELEKSINGLTSDLSFTIMSGQKVTWLLIMAKRPEEENYDSGAGDVPAFTQFVGRGNSDDAADGETLLFL